MFVEFLIFGVTDSELIMLNKKTVIIYYCNNMNIHCKWTLPPKYMVPEKAQKNKRNDIKLDFYTMSLSQAQETRGPPV